MKRSSFSLEDSAWFFLLITKSHNKVVSEASKEREKEERERRREKKNSRLISMACMVCISGYASEENAKQQSAVT